RAAATSLACAASAGSSAAPGAGVSVGPVGGGGTVGSTGSLDIVITSSSPPGLTVRRPRPSSKLLVRIRAIDETDGTMGLDPRHLLAFRAVARRGGFGRAAREIGRAGPLLEELERLPALLREGSAGRAEGPVRVGAGEGPVLYLLPRWLQAFRRRHPEIRVVVRNQPVEDTLAMLRSGELDFGLRSLERAPAGLEHRPALTFDRLLIGTRHHPALRPRRPMVEDLAPHPFVMPWPRSTTRRLLERALRARGREPEVAVEAGGWAIIKRYVAAGLGIAVVPS